MSGTQVSSFYPVNQLLADNAQQIQNYYAPRKNELLLQGEQQKISSNEMEVAARLAQGLLSLPDEAAMAAAYPNAVAYGQGLGFLKNAPSVFPGVDRLRQIASYGIPAEKQYERQANIAANRALIGNDTTAGATTAAPGGSAASSLPIPARGTGGPGASAAVPTEWLPYFYEASRETGIPVELLIAQARQESSFNPNARGAAGEIGMFQIMPSTAQSPGFGLTGVDPGTLTGPENVRNNILFGARYLKARGGAGDPNNPAWQANALRSYNAGGDPNYVANVNRYRPGLAPSDPATAVTTYTPGGAPTGGVAARTGGTDVAGPPGTVPASAATPLPQAEAVATAARTGQSVPILNGNGLMAHPDGNIGPPRAPGATPAAPAQPAATTTAQGAAPAQQPPAPAVGFSTDQQQKLKALAESGAPPSAIVALQNQFRDENRAAADTAYNRQRQAQEDQLKHEDRLRAIEKERQDALRKGQEAEARDKAAEFEREKAKFANENTLRDEFQTHTKDFRTVQTAYENITEAASAKSGAGDMSMLYAFLHMIDPQTGIKESEYGGAAAAGNLRERLQGALERVVTGGRMADSLRDSFLQEADKLYKTQLRGHNTIADQYETLAKNNGLNPANVVTRFVHPQEPRKPSGNLTTVIP